MLFGFRQNSIEYTFIQQIRQQQQTIGEHMKIFSKLKQTASSLKNKLKTSSMSLTSLTPQIYHCVYPTTPSQLHSVLNSLSPKPQNIQIYNLSEYAYSKEIIEELEKTGFEITQILYEYYSSMPLSITIQEVNKMGEFLKRGQANYVFVHCQENKSRSSMFLTAYFYLSGAFPDVASALAFVNQNLGIHSNETVFSSQHATLRNLANYHKDPSLINPESLKMTKIIINQAPKHPSLGPADGTTPLKIQLQIRKNTKILYRKICDQFGEGEIVQFQLANQNIILSDDCLFSFKYLYKEKIYPVLRVQINTNFVFGAFIRVPMQECDLVKGAEVKGHIFVDFLFSIVKDQPSELSKLNGHQGLTVINVKNILEKKKSIQNNGTNSKIKQKQEKQVKEQKNIFDIHEDEKIKVEFDQKYQEEKLNRLLEELEQKKARAQEEDIKLAQQQQQEQHKKQEEQLALEKQIAQKLKQTQNKQEQKISVKQEKKVEAQVTSTKKQQKVVQSPLNSNKQSKKVQIVKPQEQIKDKEPDEEDDVDMDDYLSKLQQQADTN